MFPTFYLALLGVVDNAAHASVLIRQMPALFPILSFCAAGAVASIPSLLRRRKKN